jgi:hypothetical protein
MRFAIVASLLLAAPLAAQSHPNVREGFWIGFGIGAGTAKLGCEQCSANTEEHSQSGYLRMGGTISPQLLIGGEVDAWTKAVNGVNLDVGSLVASVYYYPVRGGAWYLQAGAGISTAGIRGGFGGDVTGNGFALVLGTGYDWRVARNFSLTPFLTLMGSSSLDLQQNGSTLETAKPSLVHVGLGFSWH